MKPSGARAQADNRSTSEGLTMIVVVTGKNAIVKEGDDCSRLHIETDTGVEATDAALRAAELGRLRGREAELDVESLRQAGSTSQKTQDWSQRWQGMLEYADTKGWLPLTGRP